MDKLGKLDLAGTMSLAAVSAALLVAWMANSAQLAASHERNLSRDVVSLTDDGRMRVTVTAQSESPAATRNINTASTTRSSSSGPSITAIAPIFLGN
jgi:hypothetical protein